MRVHRPIALLFAATLVACSSAAEGPLRGTSGPAVVSGPLTLTPIRFGTTDPRMKAQVIDAEEDKRLRRGSG